ncbi:hypothetical protein VPHF86_0343 [Vibrio phage F86]
MKYVDNKRVILVSLVFVSLNTKRNESRGGKIPHHLSRISTLSDIRDIRDISIISLFNLRTFTASIDT